MKLVGYVFFCCLAAYMFLCQGGIRGWNHSLSCELYSLLWSCFRSRGSGAIVYGKWCFNLYVEYCGRCMFSTVGVGAGKCLGVRRIFVRISETCPKRFGRLCLQIFFPQRSWRLFLGWPPKKGLHVFFCNVWRHFMKSNKVG